MELDTLPDPAFCRTISDMAKMTAKANKKAFSGRAQKSSAATSKRAAPASPSLARVELRTESLHKELLERASALSGQPVSAFIMSAALSRARDVVREHEAVTMSDRARDALLALLEAPTAAPSDALVAALGAHRDVVHRS